MSQDFYFNYIMIDVTIDDDGLPQLLGCLGQDVLYSIPRSVPTGSVDSSLFRTHKEVVHVVLKKLRNVFFVLLLIFKRM